MNDVTPLSPFGLPVAPVVVAPPEAIHVIVDEMPEISVTVPPIEFPGSLPVTGPLTDTQLRATAVPVSGPLTDTQLRATAVPVSGPLTDTQLRATAVPVSGPLTDTQLRATAVPVSGPLTDTQLRATAVPVSAAALETNTSALKERQTWSWNVPTRAVGSNIIYLDLFNGSGSGKVIRVLAIYPIVDVDTAVTGVLGIELGVFRESSASTIGSGSAWTANTGAGGTAANSVTNHDTTNAALPAQIAGLAAPTGGGGTDTGLFATCFVAGEETSGSFSFGAQGQLNLVAVPAGAQPLTLREGQGIKVLQGSVAATGNVRFRVIFTVE